MPAEAATLDARSSTVTPPKGVRLAARLIDRRTRAWKRRCELVETFTAALGASGSIDAVLASRIEDAAEMRTIAELSRARFLAGESVPLEEITRLENAARRAEQMLSLPKRNKEQKPDALLAAVRRVFEENQA
ncbi:hypothetical protein [Sinorhizobium fredii]|uniref:hypothetical protein n=1 Tax=Rhizobium fredii TaxID=380 RepID=UPI0004B60614|nr:hypothetical protein [Sinorhizobium fredii]